LRRLVCPTHEAITEAVPFARAGSRFTADSEDLVGFLATQIDKSAICSLVRIDWGSVGRIITGVMVTGLDPGCLDGLFRIGVDEVSWRRRHQHLRGCRTTTAARPSREPRVAQWPGSMSSSTSSTGACKPTHCRVDRHVGRLRQVGPSLWTCHQGGHRPVPRRGPRTKARDTLRRQHS